MKRTALVIRHIHFEHLGILQEQLQALDFDIHYVEAPLADFSAVNAVSPDLLVVLGAPIGAFDESIYPFLQEELKLIQERIQSGKPLLGICLGAQLIARLKGGNVAPMANQAKEIGFAPIRLTQDGQQSPLKALADVPVLHWHGDQFDIPQDGIRLAETDLCPNQAFAIGHNILGLQFHMEADPSQIEAWLVGPAAALGVAGIARPHIRQDAQAVLDTLPKAGAQVFRDWVAQWDI